MRRIIYGRFGCVPFLLITLIGFASCRQGDSEEPPIESTMTKIPAGEFIMGHDQDAQPVNLPTYFIDPTEVTNAQFEEFILAGGYQKKDYWTEKGWAFIQKQQITIPKGLNRKLFNEPDQPIIGISWYEADAYCRWVGKRLPTEAEWEKAARGTDGRLYPWGNQMDFSLVAYKSSNLHRSVAVGSFPSGASPYGVLDMAGNVWEWTASTYTGEDYKYTLFDPENAPEPLEFAIIKGGSWGSNRNQFRCSYRDYERKEATQFNIGFRCVADKKKSR